MKITNTYKVLLSGFLLAIFSFVILPIKSFHNHEYAEIHSDCESSYHNAGEEDCAICNFHFETFSIDFSNQNFSKKATSVLLSTKIIFSPHQNVFFYKSLRAPPLV